MITLKSLFINAHALLVCLLYFSCLVLYGAKVHILKYLIINVALAYELFVCLNLLLQLVDL